MYSVSDSADFRLNMNFMPVATKAIAASTAIKPNPKDHGFANGPILPSVYQSPSRFVVNGIES